MGLGFKDFTAGDVLTAAQVDGYLMRQSIMVFASTSARDTALSGNLEEGMHAYNSDNDELYRYDGSAWKAVYTQWTAFTPSWTNVTTTDATQDFKKRYNNGDLEIVGAFTLGAGSSIDGAVSMTLPDSVTATTPTAVGSAVFLDANSTDSTGICITSGTSLLIYTSAVVQMNTTTPFTWASSDLFRIDMRVPQ